VGRAEAGGKEMPGEHRDRWERGEATRAPYWVLYISMFLVMSGYGLMTPVLPQFTRSLGGAGWTMGLFVALFAACQFIFSPMWGNLSDRYGRKPILVFGLVNYGLYYVVMSGATNVWTLLLARAYAGAFSCGIFPCAYAYIADTTPGDHRDAAMGRMGAAFNAGFMLGPAVGGVLAPLGPSAMCLISAGVTLLTALATAVLLRPVAGLERQRPLSDPAARERARGSALLRAVRGPIAPLLWIALLVQFARANDTTMLSFLLVDRVSADPRQVGLVLATIGAASVLVQGLAVGPAVLRLGDLRVLKIGAAILGCGYLLYLCCGQYYHFLVVAAFASVGQALLWPTLVSAVSRRTTEAQGITLGAKASFESLGRALGPAWAGFMYDCYVFIPWITAAVAVGCALALLAASSARLREVGERPPANQPTMSRLS